MIRASIFLLLLSLSAPGHAAEPPAADTDADAPAATAEPAGSAAGDGPVNSAELAGSAEAAAPVPPAAAANALPTMRFISSIMETELLEALKAEPALSALDKELAGSPLVLVVTHTVRPTAGGQAAGLLTAFLSGSTLGLIPLVTNDRLVIRYEVLLNGKSITSHSFERTATRAQNLWTAGKDGYGGLGKEGMEWTRSTAAEAAAKLARDPALLAVREEIDYYFAPQAAAAVPASPAP